MIRKSIDIYWLMRNSKNLKTLQDVTGLTREEIYRKIENIKKEYTLEGLADELGFKLEELWGVMGATKTPSDAIAVLYFMKCKKRISVDEFIKLFVVLKGINSFVIEVLKEIVKEKIEKEKYTEDDRMFY